MKTKKQKTETEKLKNILVITVGFLVLHFLFKKNLFLYISVSTGLLSLLSTKLTDIILWIWDKIALVLGWINTRILLSIVFYVLLFPLGFLFRLFAKNPLQLKNTDSSVYSTRNHLYTKEDLENPW